MVRSMLNRNISINEIITEYPTIRQFLLINDVDCMNCSVKTCLLKDILEYHNFSKEDQSEMYSIINQLAEGIDVEMKKFVPSEVSSKYSPLVDTLIAEHTYIKELLYTLLYIINKDNFLVTYKGDINTILNYLAEYADKYHHQKEEDLLFVLFRGKEIVEAMYEEHNLGREIRKKILTSKTDEEAAKHITSFCDMLDNHIFKEDNVLFPYLDRQLSFEEKERLASQLDNYDKSLEIEVINYIEGFNDREFNFS